MTIETFTIGQLSYHAPKSLWIVCMGRDDLMVKLDQLEIHCRKTRPL